MMLIVSAGIKSDSSWYTWFNGSTKGNVAIANDLAAALKMLGLFLFTCHSQTFFWKGIDHAYHYLVVRTTQRNGVCTANLKNWLYGKYLNVAGTRSAIDGASVAT
jgi:hypothetical protein